MPRTKTQSITETQSILDERFQSRQGIVPLIGNAIEVRSGLLERLRPEREQALASDAYAMHDTGAFQHVKMLGDRLSRHRRAFREPRNRLRWPVGQLSDEQQPRFVAQS